MTHCHRTGYLFLNGLLDLLKSDIFFFGSPPNSGPLLILSSCLCGTLSWFALRPSMALSLSLVSKIQFSSVRPPEGCDHWDVVKGGRESQQVRIRPKSPSKKGGKSKSKSSLHGSGMDGRFWRLSGGTCRVGFALERNLDHQFTSELTEVSANKSPGAGM